MPGCTESVRRGGTFAPLFALSPDLSRKTGKVAASTHMDGFGVYQDLNVAARSLLNDGHKSSDSRLPDVDYDRHRYLNRAASLRLVLPSLNALDQPGIHLRLARALEDFDIAHASVFVDDE